MARLFTTHDPAHIHAFLGMFCVCSFFYFYTQMVWQWSFPSVPIHITAIHCLLTFSSLLFAVPKKRNQKNPTIIWEEYRLHACCFTARSVAIHALEMIVPIHRAGMPRLLVVLLTGIVTDTVSKVWGEPNVTTVRGPGIEKIKSPTVRRIIPVYASYQIIAVISHLYPHGRRTGFNTIIAIQSSAFLMTLVRKNKIRWVTHAVVYTLCLLLSVLGIWLQVQYRHQRIFIACCVCAVTARIKFSVNKYLIWCCIATVWGVTTLYEMNLLKVVK